jgi:hypothetical protein
LAIGVISPSSLVGISPGGSSVKTDWYCLFSAAAFCLGVDSRLSFSFSVEKTEDWKNYKTTEKNVKREIEKAHREYTDKFLNLNASENPKTFYWYIKSKR